MKEPKHPILAAGKVRHAGDPIAAVIAETLAEAKSAAELIDIELADVDQLGTLFGFCQGLRDDGRDQPAWRTLPAAIITETLAEAKSAAELIDIGKLDVDQLGGALGFCQGLRDDGRDRIARMANLARGQDRMLRLLHGAGVVMSQPQGMPPTGKVRHAGDPIAAVIAGAPGTSRRSASRLRAQRSELRRVGLDRAVVRLRHVGLRHAGAPTM